MSGVLSKVAPQSQELLLQYRPNPPLVPPPSTGWLSDAFHALARLNIEGGKLCTWKHGLDNTWVEVPRPQRVTSKGAVDLAASGFRKIWPKDKSPFFCPHTRANGEPYKPLVLRLDGLYNGGTTDYFQADYLGTSTQLTQKEISTNGEITAGQTSVQGKRRCGENIGGGMDDSGERWHGAKAWNASDSQPVEITRVLSRWLSLRSRKPITWFPGRIEKEQNGELNEDEHDQDNEQDGRTSSSSPISSFPTSTPPSSIASNSSTSSDSSSISHLAVEAMLNPDPRTVLELPRRPKPFFSLGVANARKTADIDAMEYTHQIDTSGVLAEDPSSHLAWNTNNPHQLLRVYDKRIYPHCLSRTFDHLQFLYKPLGQAIRALNSPLGIPYADYASIVRSTVSCEGCLLQFLPEGYNAHIDNGHCTNHPDLVLVDVCEPTQATIRLRSFRNGRRPEKVQETLDTPVAAALLEWNSRIGIPTDVTAFASVRLKPFNWVPKFPKGFERAKAFSQRQPKAFRLFPRSSGSPNQMLALLTSLSEPGPLL
ncbi:hypothetical protein B0H11DRAFT_2373477 [Mycena galericulata]|nr:hypothetical protein B0H11DRAFT_2373477 [Mycena galericulata]